MNQDGDGRLRREFARLRWSLPLWWTATILVVLACALWLPRSWEAGFALRFDGADAAGMADAEQQLQRLLDPSSGVTLDAERQGGELRVVLSTHDRPQAFAAIASNLLDTFVEQRRQSALQAQRNEQQRLSAAAVRADAERMAARDGLNAALAALPTGGDATVAARLGRMQAEAQTLALAIRDDRARIAALQARVAEFDAAVDAASAGAGEGDAELLARRASAHEELAHLRSANAAAVRRAAELDRLTDAARAELVRLQGRNEQIQGLNEALEAATEALRSAQRRLEVHTSRMADAPVPLGFEVVDTQLEPRLAQGLEPPQVLGLAIAAGCAVAVLRLLAATVIGHERRSLALLADRLHVRALVELPTWRDTVRDPAAVLRRTSSVLVALFGVAACVLYAVMA